MWTQRWSCNRLAAIWVLTLFLDAFDSPIVGSAEVRVGPLFCILSSHRARPRWKTWRGGHQLHRQVNQRMTSRLQYQHADPTRLSPSASSDVGWLSPRPAARPVPVSLNKPLWCHWLALGPFGSRRGLKGRTSTSISRSDSVSFVLNELTDFNRRNSNHLWWCQWHPNIM